MEFDVIWNNLVPASVGNWIPGTFIMALGLSAIYGSTFKKVDRFLNLNHLLNCSTICQFFGSTVRAHQKADLESGAKPKVLNVVSYSTPRQVVATIDTPALACTIRDDSATADNATDLDDGTELRQAKQE